MKLSKPSLKSQSHIDENEAAPRLQGLSVAPILENWFASYLYAVLGYRIWPLPPLVPSPTFLVARPPGLHSHSQTQG